MTTIRIAATTKISSDSPRHPSSLECRPNLLRGVSGTCGICGCGGTVIISFGHFLRAIVLDRGQVVESKEGC